MKKDIVSILKKKKKITGDDIGRLLLADMSEEYKTFLETGQMKSIISQEEFNNLLNSLENNQIERYNRYVCLHNTIKTYMSVVRGTVNECRARVNEFKRVIESIRGAFQVKLAKEEMPLMLSQKEYADIMAECEPDKEEKYNYIDVFTYSATTLFRVYKDLKGYDIGIKGRKDRDALIKKYEAEPVTNNDLRRAYIQTKEQPSEDGYFTFNLTADKHIGKNRKEFLYKCSLMNIAPIKEKLEEYTEKDLLKPVDEVFIHNVLTAEQIREHIEYTLYPTPPETIYKSDIIDGRFITDLYKAYTKDKEEQKEIIRLFTLYCKECPEVVEYMQAYFDKFKCMKPYKDINLKDGLKPIVTMGELLRDNVADYNSWSLYAFRDEYPRAFNGVAILQEKLFNEYDKEDLIEPNGNLKEKGDYWEDLLDNIYIETIKDMAKEGEKIKGFYPSLRELYAYNEFIEILSEVTALPVVKEAFTYPVQRLEEDLEDYNRLLYLLLNMMIPAYTGKDKEEVIKFRDDLFSVFPYINKEQAQVSPENREKAEEFISNLNNFKGISAVTKPIYILTGGEGK